MKRAHFLIFLAAVWASSLMTLAGLDDSAPDRWPIVKLDEEE